MKRTLRAAAAVVAALLPLTVSAQESQPYALTKVAHQLGFHYAYLGPDEEVALSRPGVVIVVRPGAELFEVNDQTIPIQGGAPYYKNGDVYVSRPMVAELRHLAATFGYTARPSSVGVMEPMQVHQMGPVSIDALSASHIEGDQALHVEGQATPNAAITLTLMARLSSSIPDVVVTRTHVSADRAGAFAGRVMIAPAFFNQSQLIVVASTDSDTTRSVTTVVSEFPNGHSKVPSEELERAMR